MLRSVVLLILTLIITSFGGDKMIKVESPAFGFGEFIPVKYTCDGMDISPPIYWSNFPENTKSFVLIMDDPDAPIGIFTHWIVYDIPANIHGFKENVPKLPEIYGVKQGINDFGRIGYGGPCPPPGNPHRYFIKVYALDVCDLNLPPGANRHMVEAAMEDHILSEGELMGLYGR